MHGGTSFYFYVAVVALIKPVRVFHMKNILTSILLMSLVARELVVRQSSNQCSTLVTIASINMVMRCKNT
jgi:hypothetical protein